jgi:MFS transporter, DHA2 family, multidrug resistance protein
MQTAALKKRTLNPWIIAAVVMFPTAIEILDSTVANVALPYISGGLAVSINQSTWILTAYIVSNAIMLPITYWFSDKIGRKNFLLASIVVFTFASIMCGFSTSLGEMIFYRILQGFGGGGLTPLSQSILLDVFPKEKHGQAMGFFGFGILVAPIIGPYLGGWLSDNYSWHWIFFINVPIGIIAFALIKYIIPNKFNNNKKKSIHLDYIGLSLLILFLTPLQIMLDKGQQSDWFGSNFIVFLFVIMLIAFITLIFWLIKSKDPIISLKIFKNKNYSLAVIIFFIRGFVFYAFGVIYPLFMENISGYTATISGEVNMISGIAVMIMMPITGWLTSKYNPKAIALSGVFLSCFACFYITGFNAQVNFNTFVFYRALFGVGSALMFIPLNTLAFSSITKEFMTKCTGMSNLARSIGGSIGISVVTTLSIRRSQLHQNILVDNTNILNHQFIHTLNTIQTQLHVGTQEAYQIIYNTVLKESLLMSYLDVFQLMLILLLITVPFILLMIYKKKKVSLKVSH